MLCEKAVSLCEESIAKSKALLLLATGYSYKLAECRVKSERQELDKKAYDAYNKWVIYYCIIDNIISTYLLLCIFFSLVGCFTCVPDSFKLVYWGT